MDWTLWDTAFDQAAQETSYHISQGWQYDFYFGYGLDVIEEAALNEKSLIQVLRLLITEADNEILELEEDLVILQSQLAWADKEWSELCSAALKEKIECLDIAIQSLKNGSVHDEDEFEGCYQLPREPAERIHDILKALLRSYFQQKDKQAPNLVQNSTLNADKLAIGHSKKERVLSSSNLEMNMESPQKMSSTRTTTSAPILDLSVKPERRRTGTEDREKPETAVVKYSSPHHATDCNLEKRLSHIDPITIKETVVKEKCSKSIILRPSLDLEGKGTKTSETVKPADTALDSRTNAVKEATEDSISNSKQSKEPEAACPNNISTSKPSLKKYKRRITSAGRVRAREAILTGTEPCVTNLLLELPNHRKENRTRPQSKKTQRQLPKQVHEAEVGVTDEDTNSDSSTKPSRRRLKRKCHSNISEELGLILNSSSRKTAGFSRSKKGTIKEEKKARSDMCGAEDVKLSLVSLSQKKRKICPSSKKELRGLDISLASTTEEDGWIAECHLAVDSAIEPVKLLPCPNVVEYLTLVELRAIGKQQKLKGYYRLRKAELAKKLGLEIHGRGRSKGKGNGAGILSLMPGGTETEIRTPTIEDKDFVEGTALPCPKMLKAEEETEHHLELVTC